MEGVSGLSGLVGKGRVREGMAEAGEGRRVEWAGSCFGSLRGKIKEKEWGKGFLVISMERSVMLSGMDTTSRQHGATGVQGGIQGGIRDPGYGEHEQCYAEGVKHAPAPTRTPRFTWQDAETDSVSRR